VKRETWTRIYSSLRYSRFTFHVSRPPTLPPAIAAWCVPALRSRASVARRRIDFLDAHARRGEGSEFVSRTAGTICKSASAGTNRAVSKRAVPYPTPPIAAARHRDTTAAKNKIRISKRFCFLSKVASSVAAKAPPSVSVVWLTNSLQTSFFVGDEVTSLKLHPRQEIRDSSRRLLLLMS